MNNLISQFLGAIGLGVPFSNGSTPAYYRHNIGKLPPKNRTIKYLAPLLSNLHRGHFRGGIVPMKRRTRGVSRTAKRG